MREKVWGERIRVWERGLALSNLEENLTGGQRRGWFDLTDGQ